MTKIEKHFKIHIISNNVCKMTINQIFFKLCLKRNILYIIGRYATIEEVNKYLLLPLHKTVFPKSWNIMGSSKRPSKYHLFSNFLAEKKTVFSITEKIKWYSMLKKISSYRFFSFFCFLWGRSTPSPFVKNTKEKSSFYQLPALEKTPETHKIKFS